MKSLRKIGIISGLVALVLGNQNASTDERDFNFDNVKPETTYSSTSYSHIKYYHTESGARQYMQEVERLQKLGVQVLPFFTGGWDEGYEITVPKGLTLDKSARQLNYLTGRNMTWQDLYSQNKGVIGKNPNLIMPGIKLRYRTRGGTVEII